MKQGFAGMVAVGIGVLAGLAVAASDPAGGTAPAAPAMHEDAGSVDRLTGVVLETMDAGRYTYVQLQTGDRAVWAAGLQTPVAIGDTVELVGVMPMANFESATLKRTFEEIYFVSEIRVEGAVARAPAAEGAMDSGVLPPGHPPIPGQQPALPDGHPPIGDAQAAAPAAEAAANTLSGEVIQTMVGGIYTYVEVKLAEGTRWLAAPKVDLQPGQRVSFDEGMEMTDFNSPSLGRTFASVYFVPAVTPVAP
jgi:hypothetical protein